MSSPSDFTALEIRITESFPLLSKRLKQVAEYALANPNEMALDTIAVLAGNAAVQPSTLIRFAKYFGFDGFSSMQRIFKERLVGQNDYKDRIRAIASDPSAYTHSYHGFLVGAMSAIEELNQTIDTDLIQRAIKKLKQADTIYLAGFRRAFPVAAYFQYAFSHLDKKVVLLHGLGGMLAEQVRAMSPNDALLAISFREHSEEVIDLVNIADRRQIPVVSITDSGLGPVAAKSDVCLQVKEAEVQGFRSLSATMSLALIVVIGLGKEFVTANKEERIRIEEPV